MSYDTGGFGRKRKKRSGGGSTTPTPNPAPGPTPAPPPDNPGSTSDSAFDILKKFFESMGIQFDGELETLIKKFMIDGYGPEDIELLMPDLQKTRAFQARFVGWDQRVKNGYNQISIAEYLDLENQYHRILQAAGLPAGFYDDPGDFGKWIANNVSPDEIASRVQLAVNAAKSIDPTVRNLMAKFYGLSTGDVASYFLDQARALPVIERQYNAANVAGWASRVGFAVNDVAHYEDLVDKGITIDQAANSYGTIKSISDAVGNVAGIYGETYGQYDAENDVFFGVSDKRRRIMADEAATFGGSSTGLTGSAQRNNY